MSDLVEKPYSLQKAEEYENKLATLKAQQESAFLKRVQENDQYARERTVELLLEYKKLSITEEQKKKVAEASNSIYVPQEPPFFAIILIRSKNRMPAKLKTICKLLRLEKINTCVLAKNNKATRQMLQRLRNYIAYGYLNINTLRTLFYKRALCRINSQPLNITNEVIEDYFNGELRCMEDLIYNIYTGSPLFKKINSFLLPFKLSCPVKGFKGKKSRDLTEGGSAGNHFDQLYLLLERMI
ncbi:60S ribosomal protein L7 [Dictyocoela muelleri]|nr:60S ribosomal protein L7 [Dictyocoela muelleri]